MDVPHGYVLLVDLSGLRHAVNVRAITALRDVDETRLETVVVTNWGREAFVAAEPLETVIVRVCAAASNELTSGPGRRR